MTAGYFEGLAGSETGQIDVVNLAANSSTGTPASCTGSISFFNAAGTVIGAATPFTVTSGQIFSASLPFTKAGATTTRAAVRGVVTLTGTRGSGVPCALASSLEIYDTTSGVTHVFIGDAGAGGGGAGGPGPGR